MHCGHKDVFAKLVSGYFYLSGAFYVCYFFFCSFRELMMVRETDRETDWRTL